LSVYYSKYLVNEKIYDKLWSINDNSWVFYSRCTELMICNCYNKYYDKLYAYYKDNFNFFKIVYNDYEGLFNTKDYPTIITNKNSLTNIFLFDKNQ